MNAVAERTARSSGARILVIDNRDGSFDSDDSRDAAWATLCDDHGQAILHRTKLLAESWASRPEEWCDDCRSQVDRRTVTRLSNMVLKAGQQVHPLDLVARLEWMRELADGRVGIERRAVLDAIQRTRGRG